jgi:hypothetical protein
MIRFFDLIKSFSPPVGWIRAVYLEQETKFVVPIHKANVR